MLSDTKGKLQDLWSDAEAEFKRVEKAFDQLDDTTVGELPEVIKNMKRDLNDGLNRLNELEKALDNIEAEDA